MKMLRNIGLLVLFQVVAFLPSLGAMWIETEGWYEELYKPAWTPANEVFGPVWGCLYVLIGLAGFFAWRRGGRRDRAAAFSIYGLQLLLNGVWTPLFFGLQRPAWALGVLVLLWFQVLLCIAVFTQRSRLATGLMFPYFLWISFAGALNAAIVVIN